MNARYTIAVFTLSALGIASGWLLFGWLQTTPTAETLTRELDATVVPADYAKWPEVTLNTASARLKSSDIAGRSTLLFMGFTNCRNVCPTTLRKVAEANSILRQQGASVPRTLFVSVDYRRDTPKTASKYASGFGEAFVGATADQQTLRELAGALNVSFSLPDAPAGDGYRLQHSSALFLLDGRARVRAVFSPPHSPSSLAKEIRRIRSALASTWERNSA